MAKDSELQKCTVNIPIFNRLGFTQFTVVPTASVEKIGNITESSNILTLNNVEGVAVDQYIYANGILSGTKVESISGQQVTMTTDATDTIQYQNIIFYEVLEDGLLPLKKGQTVKFL